MYRYLEHDEARRLPAACDRYEKAVTLSGLSKSFALPGLRIGWLATRTSSLLERCTELKDYTTICHSAPSEILALIALRARTAITGRNRELVRENLAHARRFFAAHAAVRWLEPDGGSTVFPEWLGRGNVEAFCRAALDQEGVLIVPGSMFGFEGPHFRLGLGRRNFAEGLERVRLLVDAG
jgi:aspartate/methionine/tyrosine aminotransferase